MKSVIAVAVLSLAIVLPGAALAQNMDINRIISSIGGYEFEEGAVRLDSSPSLRVVRLSTLAGADGAADRLWAVRDSKAGALRLLHSNLMQNWFARRATENAGVTIEQIVAFDLAGDGAAVLYADDL